MILLVCTNVKHSPQTIAIMIRPQEIVQKLILAPGGTIIAINPTSMVDILMVLSTQRGCPGFTGKTPIILSRGLR